MKHTKHLLLALAAIVLTLGLQSCLEDECTATQTFTRWNPIFLTLDELRSSVQSSEPRELVNPGKFFYYNGYLLVNELNEGIHVIDNRDPSNPQPVSFLEIPGNVDMAVRDDILYADMYLDVLSIDISDPAAISVLDREEGVFEGTFPVNDNRILVRWEETEETIEINCEDTRWNQGWFTLDNATFFGSQAENSVVRGGGTTSAPNVSVAGSLARFTTLGDYLYVLDRNNIITLDLPAGLEVTSTQEVGWNIETIFPYDNNLFIGSDQGMFIYSLEDPSAPTFRSAFEHARACDPVYVQDEIAYITLRSGNPCRGFTNQLDIVDVSDIESPELLRTHQMDNPHGLSVQGDELYLCEGESGLKVLDISDAITGEVDLLDQISSVHAYDVIVLSQIDLAMLVGQDGIYQYDISDPSSIEEISVITVNRP